MSCNCETYSCLNVAPTVETCPDAFVVDLVATETGAWIMQYEFNGRWINKSIDVIENVQLSLPNVFNELYKHTIRFYNTDGELVNDTCYTLNTSKVGVGSVSRETSDSNTSKVYKYIVVETPDGLDDLGRMEVSAGSTIIDNRLIGKKLTTVTIGGQSYDELAYSKPLQSNTFTWNDIIMDLGAVVTGYFE